MGAEQIATGQRPVIDAKLAAQQLGVKTGTVYKLLRQGQLEGYAVGRRRLIYADGIDAFRRRNAFSRPSPTVSDPKPARRRMS